MRLLLTTVLFFCLLPFAGLAQGLLSGRIVDSSNLSLPGATIEIKNLSKKTVSDETGRYKLLGIPNGSYTVIISYIGFATIQQKVSISNDKAVALDIVMAPEAHNKLQEVVITGSTGSALKALNQQKNSNRIVNIISADQIGRFPIPISVMR